MITFNNQVQYTLKATYTLPDGSSLVDTKYVNMSPVVIASSTDMFGLGDSNTVVWHPGDSAGFGVSHRLSGGIYEWSVNHTEWLVVSGSSVTLDPPQTHPDGPNATSRPIIYASCRVQVNGVWSDWSNEASIELDYSTVQPASAKKPASDSLKMSAQPEVKLSGTAGSI
jgi:hypothetical protein